MSQEWKEKIEQLQKAKGLSQVALADQLGITTRTLYEFLQNRRDPSGPAARLIDSMLESLGAGATSAPLITDARPKTISPRELYGQAEELWILGDHPLNAVDLESLLDTRLCADSGALTLTVFFMSSLEGAEQFAEELARKLIDLDETGQVTTQRNFSSYAYVLVTNTLFAFPDLVIANPGSNCCAVSSTMSREVFAMAGDMYVKINSNAETFTRTAARLRLGASQQKKNFFPVGKKLEKDILFFRHAYLDAGMYGVRGNQPGEQGGQLDEIATNPDEGGIGGVFRSVEGREAQSKEFDAKCRYAPVFILTYKRGPGDDVGDRPLKALSISVVQDKKTSTFW